MKKVNSDKVCLVLGVTSDIAKAIAEEFAKLGYNLILTGRNLEQTSRIAEDIRIRYNVETQSLELEISNLSSHQAFLQKLNILPDVLVLAIGYLGDQKESENNFSESKKVIDINYAYPINLLNYFANEFEKRRSGAIIGISSVAGDRGRKVNYIYGASKAALTAYLSGLRNRLASFNVNVLTIKPGFVRTKMTEHLDLPGKFTAEPSEVAKDTINAFLKKKDVIYTKKYTGICFS